MQREAASAQRERVQLEAKLALHLTRSQARSCVAALRSDSLVRKLVSVQVHCRKTPKELAEHVMSRYLEGQAAGRNVQVPQLLMPPARAAPLLDHERSLLLECATASFNAQSGATRWWVKLRLKVGAAGGIRVALQRATAIRLIDGAELSAVLCDRQDLLRVVQPCVKLDGLIAVMEKPCKQQKHWEPASAVEVRNELQLAQMVHTSGGDACRTFLGIARLVVVGGSHLCSTYLVRDAGLLPLEMIMGYLSRELAAHEPQKAASAAAEMHGVIGEGLQGLLQLHERGFAYNRGSLRVAFRKTESGVRGVLLGFGRLTELKPQLICSDLQAAFDLFVQAAHTLDFWQESVEYAHTWQIFADSGSTLKQKGLRMALMVLNDMESCYARICKRRQQQEALRAARLKLQAEHAERAARERQAALANAAERERVRHLYDDVTARRPTRAWQWLGQQPQLSSSTQETIAGLRAKRWRQGKQTLADLRRVQSDTDISELLGLVLGPIVVERLKQRGWSTVERLLKAGADKAVEVVPIGMPSLRQQLTQVMAALRSHLGIHPKGSWGAVLEDDTDGGNESDRSGPDESELNRKRAKK